MSLELVKPLNELSPNQFDQIINNNRVKRLYLRIEFKKAYDARLAIQSKRQRALLDKQLSIMAKDMEQLDKVIEKCAQRLDKIKIITNQVTYLDDAISDEED